MGGMVYKLIVASLVAVVLTSCGVSKAYIKKYDGPVKSRAEVALVKPQLFIVVRAINGDTSIKIAPLKALGIEDTEIAFLPGHVEFQLDYDDGFLKAGQVRTISEDLKAGRKYLIRNRTQPVNSWDPEIIDVTDLPEYWCYNGKGCLD